MTMSEMKAALRSLSPRAYDPQDVYIDDPYGEGRLARQDGVPYLCNPYTNDATITQPLAWAQGWMDEDKALRTR